MRKITVGKKLLSLVLRFTLTLFTVSCGTNLMAQQLDVDPALRTQGASYEQNARRCPADAIKILLIGNSYTHYYRMPETLEKLLNAHANEDALYCVRHHAPGGYTLFKDHLPYFQKPNNPFVFDMDQTCDAVQKGCTALFYRSWDHIVVQGHSYYHPRSEKDASIRNKLNQALESLADTFATFKGQFHLFVTWGYKEGHIKGLSSDAGYFQDFLSMQDSINAAYLNSCELLSDKAPTDLIPVGQAFHKVYQSDFDFFNALYAEDGRHPSRLGSFLIASVLAAQFFSKVEAGQEPKYRPSEISPADAKALWQLAVADEPRYCINP